MRVCRWAFFDSDASQHGIGVWFWSIKQQSKETRQAFKTRWIRMWDAAISVTLFGNTQLCDLNPVNRPI